MQIAQVISKYERIASNLESGRVGAAAHAELAVNLSANLKHLAIEALTASGEVSEQNTERARQFVETFSAYISTNSSRYTLSIPDPSTTSMTPAREDIEEWVRRGYEDNSTDNTQGKVFDARDINVDDTVRRMQYILLSSPEGERGAAQDKYLPMIAEFLAAGITDALIDKWSQIVLTAWVTYVRDTAIAYGVRALRRELVA